MKIENEEFKETLELFAISNYAQLTQWKQSGEEVFLLTSETIKRENILLRDNPGEAKKSSDYREEAGRSLLPEEENTVFFWLKNHPLILVSTEEKEWIKNIISSDDALLLKRIKRPGSVTHFFLLPETSLIIKREK